MGRGDWARMFGQGCSASVEWGESAPGRDWMSPAGPSAPLLEDSVSPHRPPAGRSGATNPSQMNWLFHFLHVWPQKDDLEFKCPVLSSSGCPWPCVSGELLEWMPHAACTEELALSWAAGPSFPLLSQSVLPGAEDGNLAFSYFLYHLCIINHISPPWLLHHGASHNAFLLHQQEPAGKYLFQAEILFPTTAEKHFYGQWWGNASLRNFQRKLEPVSSSSGFLLSQREKLKSWRPRRTQQAMCSLHTHLLPADDPISDIWSTIRVWQTSYYWTNLRDWQFLVPLARTQPHMHTPFLTKKV